MEVSRMKEMGFVPTIDLEEGIDQMIESYQKTLS